MVQIIDIIKSKTSMEILELFLEEQKELYQQEIEDRTGFSRNTLIKWLAILIEKEFLELKTRGKEKYYRINENNPVIKQLKIILTVSRLCPLIKDLEAEVYLFGSCAKGEETKESDVDILVIGNPSRAAVSEFVEHAKKSTKREVKPIIMNPIEYSRLIRKDRLFYENIERSKIRLK